MAQPRLDAAPDAHADALAAAQLGPIALRNRVIKAATFEGASPGGLVSERLIDFHVAVGRGGAALSTVAYCAVAPEGRTEADQLWWRPEVLPGLERLTAAVHATGARVSAQIGHAGPVANSASTKLRALGPSRLFGPQALRFCKAADTDDLERVIAAHADAAALAADVGFDAVELHFGHNYLVSAFLSPALNRRADAWGGALSNRARLARRVAEAVRVRVGSRVGVLAKINMNDGVRGGLAEEESLAFARLLESDGHLDALVLSGGSSLKNPMYLFKGDVPLREMAASQPPHLRLGVRAFGGLILKHYPYEPLYFLAQARPFRAALRMPLVLLGGVTDAAGMDAAMREGFDFVAMGRALLREPDLIRRIGEDRAVQSTCTHCNLCVPTIFTGTRCPLNDPPPR